MQTKWPILTVAVVAAVGVASAIASRFAFFVAPLAWTGEPARLREVLGVKPGARVADIGAGSGALAIDMARAVGASGLVYASEMSADQRRAIAARQRREGLAHVQVVTAEADATNLPDACCDAVYLRAVFHHIDDRPGFARAIASAVKPGGRVAIIDFPPGGLWFHGADHGVTAEAVTQAFEGSGMTLTRSISDWGGGMFLLLFTR